MVRGTRRIGLTAALCSALACSAWAGPVEEAQQAYDQGDYTLAESIYEQAATQSPGLLDDASFMSAWERAQSRVAYAAGSRLHAEGEYDAAVDQFMLAIAKDADNKLAFAALDDAQRLGVRKHLLTAIQSADAGDLLTAKAHLERSLVLGGAGNDQVTTALTGISAPDDVFDQETLAKLAEAKRLGEDRQWGLAQTQLAALVEANPLLLPARAELARAERFKAMSVALTDEAAALMAQQRMSPAREKLASAASVWPYNERAAELLETVEATIRRADALVAEAAGLKAQEDWRGANEKLVEALVIDPSHAEARALRSEVRVGLVEMLGGQAQAALDEGDYTRARTLLDRADQYWSNNRWTRRGLAEYRAALGAKAAEADRPGEAYLRYVLAARNTEVGDVLADYERRFLRDADLTFVYDIAPNSPAIGVTSAQLADALAFPDQPTAEDADGCFQLLHDGRVVPATPGDADGQARYTVGIHITDTDIQLRQRDGGATNASYTSFGSSYAVRSYNYWEKYGTVACVVILTDQATGEEVSRWTSSRWANYTDQQQYVVGRTWNTNYWTLPTDDAIEARLARDLAEQLRPQITERLTLARARALRDEAAALAEDGGNATAAMDKRVTAVVLAGEVNPREARRELVRMARELDEAHPTPAR